MMAGEYCNSEVIITGQNASVTEAAMLMRQHHVGDLVVVEKQGEKNLPTRIITDRDINELNLLALGCPPFALCLNG